MLKNLEEKNNLDDNKSKNWEKVKEIKDLYQKISDLRIDIRKLNEKNVSVRNKINII